MLMCFEEATEMWKESFEISAQPYTETCTAVLKFFLSITIRLCNALDWVSNVRPMGQNRPGKDSHPAHWMALENVKEGLNCMYCILIHFTAFPTAKILPDDHSYDTKVIMSKINN